MREVFPNFHWGLPRHRVLTLTTGLFSLVDLMSPPKLGATCKYLTLIGVQHRARHMKHSEHASMLMAAEPKQFFLFFFFF